ncbi:MAG TPA: hypothetical protein VK638_30340 [Edaphobacter sp.]|nr:hypothetical protein [Edaphobacter sp.]
MSIDHWKPPGKGAAFVAGRSGDSQLSLRLCGLILAALAVDTRHIAPRCPVSDRRRSRREQADLKKLMLLLPGYVA